MLSSVCFCVYDCVYAFAYANNCLHSYNVYGDRVLKTEGQSGYEKCNKLSIE